MSDTTNVKSPNYQRRNIEIVYLVYAHHSNYIFFKDDVFRKEG